MSSEAKLAPGETVVPCPLQERWAIEVLVVDEDNKPLGDVVVQLSRSRQEVLLQRTGPNGMVRFEELIAGSYQFTLPLVDQKAWALIATKALDEPKSSGDASWIAPPEAEEKSSHDVELGDCMASIGFEHGFLPQTLWDHNANLHSDDKRRHILSPGDVVALPKRGQRQENAATGNQYKVRRKGVPERLNVRFVNYRGQPRAGLKFVLHIETASGTPVPDKIGKLDGDGFVKEPLPADAVLAEIELQEPDGAREIVEVQLGYVNPLNEVSGAQARLNNLHYAAGPEDGELNEQTVAALRQFQHDHELPITGKLDAATKEALQSAHLS